MTTENDEYITRSGPPVSIANLQVKWVKAETPTIYANVLTASVTPVDLNIYLGEIEFADETGVVSRPRVKLIVTPEFAATMMKALRDGLRLFAGSHGSLRPNAGYSPTPESE